MMEFTEIVREIQPDESEVYTFAIPEIKPFLIGRKRRKQEEVLTNAAEQDGFVGFHPVIGRGTLCLYETENDAIRARNIIKGMCQVGDNIVKCHIKTEYVESARKRRQAEDEV